MLYFSEVRNKPVNSTASLPLGKLVDMIFLASESLRITKLVVRTHSGDTMIAVKSVTMLRSGLVVETDSVPATIHDNELSIEKHLIDKQIIDLVGSKLVRVNDVVLLEHSTTIEHNLFLTGVDIGIFGILRRLHLEEVARKACNLFSMKSTSQYLSWTDIQPLDLSNGQLKLKQVVDKLQKMRPEDLADYLEHTNEKTLHHVLRQLGVSKASDVVENLEISYQKDLFAHWNSKEAAELIEHMDPDEGVDILLMLSKQKYDEVWQLLPEKSKKRLKHLLHLSATDIGALSTTDFLTVKSTSSAQEVMLHIKKDTEQFSSLQSVYVLNETEQLVGVFNLHELLLQKGDTPVFKFMNQSLVEVFLSTPVHVAVHKMLKYHINSLPVIDRERHMVGMVTVDDVSEYIEKKLYS